MVYNIAVNYLNLLKENIIRIIINKLMLIKFIMKIMLKYVLNVNKLNQLQTLVNITQNQMDYKIDVNHVNLL